MMRRSASAGLVALLIALSACTSTPVDTPSSEPGFATAPAVTPSRSEAPISSSPGASQDPTEPETTLASGLALPACEPDAPDPFDTVAFVASGHAWGLSPSGARLTCLFEAPNAGPFEWGPLGDRAILGALEVKSVVHGPSVAASDQTFTAVAWSQPIGKSIVYAPGAGTSLKKIHVDGTPAQDVTPLTSATYLSVTYHPSGEAFAFAVDQGGDQSIWMSSNTGKKPARVVFSEEGTRFGAIAFDVDGKHLFYAAQHADNHAELHRIDVTDLTRAPVVWAGSVGSTVLDIEPGPKRGTVAWTTETAPCQGRVAMAHTPTGTVQVLPGVTKPTQAIGWLSTTQLLVATGECDGPLDLSAVDVSTGSIVPLVSGVSAAAVRTPVPTPPARLPKSVPTKGSGFG